MSIEALTIPDIKTNFVGIHLVDIPPHSVVPGLKVNFIARQHGKKET